ncbi:MAG: EAL domain-containing protein [Candidatus Thiodiazotropha taylori]
MNSALTLVDSNRSGSIPPEKVEELLSMQLSVLKMVANGLKTEKILNELCLLSESMLPNSVASIMLFDETRSHLKVRSAPSIPEEGIQYLDGLKPGPKSGSCGTAVFTGKPVFVENTKEDDRWLQFRELVDLFDICACWSTPIRASTENVVGSFALTSFETRKPDYFYRCLLDTGAHLVAIVIDRETQSQHLQRTSIAFDNINEGVIVTDASQKILEVNQAFIDITGYQIEDVLFKTPRVLSSGLESPEFYREFWDQLNAFGHWSGEIRNKRKNGEVFTEWLSVKCVYDDYGELKNYVAILSDISELKEAEDKLRHLAHHDTLTDLPNRLYFQNRLEQALSLATRHKKQLGLLFLDLDNFKNVNDTLGHQVGDELLKKVADRLYHSLRKHDVIARHGGDEFLVLIEDIIGPVELRYITDNIRQSLSEPVHLGNLEFNISVSIGISIYPENGLTRDSLLRNADAAMYEAKKNGRNGVAFYTPELTEAVQSRVSLEGDLRRALNSEQITLNYQPQFDTLTRELIGVEVLVRWRHPIRGWISPAEFIPIAEETGLISELGCWITRTACRQAQTWREKGLKEFKLAINLSPHQLKDDCAERISEILNSTGFPARLLEFEITESLLMESGSIAIDRLFNIKDIGVGLAMDDFGTGHSSMSQLKHLPIQKLKIDRSFIKDIPDDPNDVAITRSIIALGHALELKVLAEGVETSAQMEFLKKEKCDFLQGYYLSKPVTAEGFEAILNKLAQDS